MGHVSSKEGFPGVDPSPEAFDTPLVLASSKSLGLPKLERFVVHIFHRDPSESSKNEFVMKIHDESDVFFFLFWDAKVGLLTGGSPPPTQPFKLSELHWLS